MNDQFRADLHSHSIFSDGSDAPMELLQKAKLAGLSAFSITDHDTISGYSPELFQEAKNLGIVLVPGIELSSELMNYSVHILGYNFDLNSQMLLDHLSQMQERRNNRNHDILKKLRDHGVEISLDEVQNVALLDEKQKSIGRPHIAQVMIQKGYVSSIQEAFEKYLSEGACCYSSGFRVSPLETIEVIQKSGGKAILAHPHVIRNASLMGSLLNMPFDGIEVYYGALPLHFHWRWLKIAEKKGWIVTGGSDYHGALKPYISLGNSWVGRDKFEALVKPRG